MCPTVKGKNLLTVARGISIKAESLYTITKQKTESAQPVRVLMSRGASLGAAVELARRYHGFDLCNHLFFEEWPRSEIPALLMQHTANIALVLFPQLDIDYYRPRLAQSGISLKVMYSSHFYLLCSKQHLLAEKGELPDDVFQTESFCTITGADSTDIDSVFSNLSNKCRYLVAVTNFSLMRDLILQQNMLGIHNWYTLCAGRIYDPEKMAVFILPEDFMLCDLHLCLLHRSCQSLRCQERILLNCIEKYFCGLHLPDQPDVHPAGANCSAGREE